MSTYAEVAASGPPQSEEEARANPVDEVLPTSSVETLVDVDSGVTVVESDFLEKEIKTETQKNRIEGEAEAAAEEQSRAKKAADKAASSKKAGKDNAKRFACHPIVAINTATVLGLSAFLGFGAYRKHQVGELSWKLVGMWSAGMAAFGAADFFLSSYLFKEYPVQPKK